MICTPEMYDVWIIWKETMVYVKLILGEDFHE